MNLKRFLAFVLMTMLTVVSLATAQSRQEPGDRGQTQAAEQPNAPNASADAQVVPPELTLPVGTLIIARTVQPLSSDRNKPGDGFTAILEQPLVAQGWVVARHGQTVLGNVVAAQKAGRNQDNSELAVELNELMLVDGQQLPVRTTLVQISSGSSGSRTRENAGIIGATTGIGAVIGAVAGGGKGAAVGAAVGAGAGIAGVLTTRGRPTEIDPETELTFRLETTAIVSTERSQQAFAPVTQGDYDHRPVRNPDRYPAVRNYPPPPVYYVPYYYGWYPYPYGYYGYYGAWYYPSFRIYARRGWGRRW